MNKNTYEYVLLFLNRHKYVILKYVLLFLNRYKYVLLFLFSLVISAEILDSTDRELQGMTTNSLEGSKNQATIVNLKAKIVNLQATIVNLQEQIDETNSK